MGLKVLIVPDKFKGTLTARAAAAAIAAGWRRERPKDALDLLPMSDGGDGFGEVLSVLMGAVSRTVKTCDAAHRPCSARWWWHGPSRTAIIETAGVVGLAMLPPGRYHPFELDTVGLGHALAEALKQNPRRLLVGLGGSATNDGGFGMARALGWEFLDSYGKAIERWTELPAVNRLRRPKGLPGSVEITVAVDVQNRLLGARGATRVYGPQKGMRVSDFPLAECCLCRLARLVRTTAGVDLAGTAGAGAAGGLGFGFAAFLRGRLEPGFELFSRESQLDRRLSAADLVITGEGALDRSTFMGKGAGQVARRCRAAGIPCIGLAGLITPRTLTRRSFHEIHALADLTSAGDARNQAGMWLERLAAQVAKQWTGKEQQKAGKRKAERSEPAKGGGKA